MMSNMRASTTGAESTTTKSRGSTDSYCKTIRENMNINKRPRPRMMVPLSNLPFSFGPTTTRKKDNNDTTAMTEYILDDVLATMATTTTTSQHSENAPQEHRQMQRVSFSTKTDIQYIPTRHEISSEEYKEAWYSRAELDSISESCLEQIRSITTNRNNYFHLVGDHDLTRSGTNMDDEEESFVFRGLESFTPVASKAKKMNRSACVQAVLNEQDRQKQSPLLQHYQDKDANDDHGESIRKIYHGISSSSQLWAHAVALKDRREVEDIVMDDEEEECCRDREVSTASEMILHKPLMQGGVRRRRGVSRSHSSNSTNNSGTKGQPKKRCKPFPRRNGPVTSSSSTCRWDATMPLHGAEKAMHHRVMAIAA